MRRLFAMSMATAVFLVLLLALTMVGSRLAPVSTVSAAGGWTAYNDCNYLTDAASGVITGNITQIVCRTAGSGRLRNYGTGAYMAVTLTVATGGTVEDQSSSSLWGGDVIKGTDAYTMFHGTVAITGGIRLGNSGTNYVRLTIAGLNPSMVYEFAVATNRHAYSYTARTSKFMIGDVTTATNASSIRPGIGVTRTTTVLYQDSSTYCTGYNYNNGYVARWLNIQPGADGDIVITTTNGASGQYGYGPAVFMLKEIDTTAAELTSFAANPAVGRIRVTWDAASEVGSLGFHVYRATHANGERERLTASLIASQAPGSASGGHYQFVDDTAVPGLTYYYWVELVALDGATQLHGPISARASLYLKPPPARN